jgi:predicted GIY-YIG superfamily endonuclease
VYLIFKNDRAIYVGRAENVHVRIHQHSNNLGFGWRAKSREGWEFFVRYCKDSQEAVDLEYRYTKKLRPLFNGRYAALMDPNLSEVIWEKARARWQTLEAVEAEREVQR